MDVWRIGSRWSEHGEAWSSILDVFYNSKTVFAGNYKENFSNSVKVDDLFAVTSGEKIVAVAKAISAPDVLNNFGIDVDEFYSSNYEDFDYQYEFNNAVGCKVKIYELRKEDILPIHRGKTFCHANNVRQKTIKLFEKYENEEKGIGMVENIKELLKKSHNLILTGAPGTGKTFLAKQVAEAMTTVSANTKSPLELLDEAIKNFKEDSDVSKKDKELLKTFQTLYPHDKIKELTLEKYCIGTGSNLSFCWWIERGLASIGIYSPGSSKTYKIWFNKETDSYLYSSFIKESADNNPEKSAEDLMEELASELDKVINKRDFTNLKFGASFILKILNSYFPDEYLPINSEKHIDNLIKILELSVECAEKNIFEKNRIIYDFYKKKTKENMTPVDFMRILYSLFNLEIDSTVTKSNTAALDGEVAFVQFHPSFDYTDFIEGLRPTAPDENGVVGFEKLDGVFKSFCMNALDNPSKNYVFIIDEINRGEISKIFGELFYSIDPGYRVSQEMLKMHANGTKRVSIIRTQYANMDKKPNRFDLALEEKDTFGHFFIPDNVYILGTMNDIDRSVESMDFAFRRRFTWKEIKASDTQKVIIHNSDSWNGVLPTETVLKKIDSTMQKLNNAIWDDSTETGIEGFSTAYHIGASYFLKLALYFQDDDPFYELWTNHLESLLKEYLRGTGHEQDIKELRKVYFSEGDMQQEGDE